MIWEIDESRREIEGLDAHGRPIPSYAASLGLRRARYGQRVLATLIEGAVLVVLQLPMLLAVLPELVSAALSDGPTPTLATSGNLVLIIVLSAISSFLSTVFIVVQLILHGRRGLTIGKAITGVRSVNVRTLERPGFWRGAVVRYLVEWGSFLIPFLGPVLVVACSPLFDPKRRGRGWPDLAAATWFVDIRHGLNPYDAKRMRIARKTVATTLNDERTPLPSLATPAEAAAAFGPPGPAAPPAYVPTVRNSGGVLGLPRSDTDPPRSDPPQPDRPPVAPDSPVLPTHPAPSARPDAPSTPPPAVDGLITAAPWQSQPTTLVLELDTGERVPVEGNGVLIGRAPVAGADDAGLLPVAVADPTLSKTHLTVRRSGTRVFVVDRGSTNGSSLIHDGVDRALTPGEGIEIAAGDTIRFGERQALVTRARA